MVSVEQRGLTVLITKQGERKVVFIWMHQLGFGCHFQLGSMGMSFFYQERNELGKFILKDNCMRPSSLFTKLYVGACSTGLEIAHFQLFPVAWRAGCTCQHLLLAAQFQTRFGNECWVPRLCLCQNPLVGQEPKSSVNSG